MKVYFQSYFLRMKLSIRPDVFSTSQQFSAWELIDLAYQSNNLVETWNFTKNKL